MRRSLSTVKFEIRSPCYPTPPISGAQLWWSDTYRRRGVSDSARIGLVLAIRLAGSDPKPPAQALLAVHRKWIMAGGPEGHPSRWAPFILVGSVLQ
ncbi:MAG: hypothetical protein ABIZ96_07415 [Gemmatimonadales bacterium]